MATWADITDHLLNPNCASSVLVTVGATRGSTPRETGTKMIVSDDSIVGTIGGGQLEHVVIRKARELLADKRLPKNELMQLPLGPELAQCCGGYTEIILSRVEESDHGWLGDIRKALVNGEECTLQTHWTKDSVIRTVEQNEDNLKHVSFEEAEKYSGHFTLAEPLEEKWFHLVLFGAGHVGKAIVHSASALPCSIDWVDARKDEFPKQIPPKVKAQNDIDPVQFAKSIPSGAYVLIMTHSHILDFDLCKELAGRRDLSLLGLIGSKTKKARFFNRLKNAGFTEQALNNIACPIGEPELTGKHPAEIAISVTSQLIKLSRTEMNSRSLETQGGIQQANN